MKRGRNRTDLNISDLLVRVRVGACNGTGGGRAAGAGQRRLPHRAPFRPGQEFGANPPAAGVCVRVYVRVRVCMCARACVLLCLTRSPATAVVVVVAAGCMAGIGPNGWWLGRRVGHESVCCQSVYRMPVCVRVYVRVRVFM